MNRTVPDEAYAILGVSRTDSFETIRRAWKSLVKTNHPDLSGMGGDSQARRLAEINNAFDLMRFHVLAKGRSQPGPTPEPSDSGPSHPTRKPPRDRDRQRANHARAGAEPATGAPRSTPRVRTGVSRPGPQPGDHLRREQSQTAGTTMRSGSKAQDAIAKFETTLQKIRMFHRPRVSSGI